MEQLLPQHRHLEDCSEVHLQLHLLQGVCLERHQLHQHQLLEALDLEQLLLQHRHLEDCLEAHLHLLQGGSLVVLPQQLRQLVGLDLEQRLLQQQLRQLVGSDLEQQLLQRQLRQFIYGVLQHGSGARRRLAVRLCSGWLRLDEA